MCPHPPDPTAPWEQGPLHPGGGGCEAAPVLSRVEEEWEGGGNSLGVTVLV